MEAAVLVFIAERPVGAPLYTVAEGCKEADHLRSRVDHATRTLIDRGLVETFDNRDDDITPTWIRLTSNGRELVGRHGVDHDGTFTLAEEFIRGHTKST